MINASDYFERMKNMIKIVIDIDGMMCGMCESHINDAIRQNFNVKKVKSSHTKGQTEIIAENDIDDNKLRQVIDQTGYKVLSVTKSPYEKKGLFSFHKK